MIPTKIDRLYAILKGYERDVNDLSDRVAFLGQDLRYLLDEIKDLTDKGE